MTFHHETVLLRETVAALRPGPGGAYLDGTAGGGGHTALLLEEIHREGRVYALDRDPDAIAALRARFANEPAVTVLHGNFFEADKLVPGPLDGVLLDLGASSHQLDTAARGFSYHKEALLDMRMSQTGTTAAQLVNTLPEADLRRILYEYAQEKFAPRIAKAIVSARPIETTTQLAEIVANAVPAAARRGGHPARKTFMALRYACNGELDGLEDALVRLFALLKPGGRLAVITFNSLEDAAVKHVTKALTAGCECPPEFPVCVCGKAPRARVPQKPITPLRGELENNGRSRSAKLRTLERNAEC